MGPCIKWRHFRVLKGDLSILHSSYRNSVADFLQLRSAWSRHWPSRRITVLCFNSRLWRHNRRRVRSRNSIVSDRGNNTSWPMKLGANLKQKETKSLVPDASSSSIMHASVVVVTSIESDSGNNTTMCYYLQKIFSWWQVTAERINVCIHWKRFSLIVR